jgi:hypothetical protein
MTDPKMMETYNFYECSCFNIASKYNISPWSGWGNLKDATLKKQYSEYDCSCYVAQDKYKITPNPKDWGTLTDKDIRRQWDENVCDSIMNIEPFINNPSVTPTPTTSTVPTSSPTSVSCNRPLGLGDGKTGECCKVDDDCEDTCTAKKCGIHP